MRFRSGLAFALGTVFAISGCAAGGVGGGPSVSPTGRVYEPGIPPRDTEFSRAANNAIARAQLGLDEASTQSQFEEALAQARQGIAADTANPVHFYVGGEAAVGMGDFELADSMWSEAERIYPAYELEIEPSRENAWANAFNEGVEAYNNGDVATAREVWTGASLIYKFRPEAAQNLAILLTNEGDYDAAIASYQRGIESIDLRPGTRIIDDAEIAEREDTRQFMQQNLGELLLFRSRYEEAEPIYRSLVEANPDDVQAQANLARVLTQLGRADEAAAIYNRLLSAPNLPPSELFGIGVALFQSNDYARAADAFGRVAQLQPGSRDAWFNQANALLAEEDWQTLLPIGERLIEIDPLSSQSALILTQAYRELERSQDALVTLQRVEALPVWLDQLQLQPGAQRSILSGEITGNAATAGSPIQLRFIFFDDNGEVGATSVTLPAPAREARETFEVEVAGMANAYRYEVVN